MRAALSLLLLAGARGALAAEPSPWPYGQVSEPELVTAQALGGLAAFLVGAAAGDRLATELDLYRLDLCVGSSRGCPGEGANERRLALAAALVLGTGNLTAALSTQALEAVRGERSAPWWAAPLFGLLAEALVGAGTYALYQAGVDVLVPGLAGAALAAIGGQLLGVRLFRPEP